MLPSLLGAKNLPEFFKMWSIQEGCKLSCKNVKCASFERTVGCDVKEKQYIPVAIKDGHIRDAIRKYFSFEEEVPDKDCNFCKAKIVKYDAKQNCVKTFVN